jgi:hypothetical protein
MPLSLSEPSLELATIVIRALFGELNWVEASLVCFSCDQKLSDYKGSALQEV